MKRLLFAFVFLFCLLTVPTISYSQSESKKNDFDQKMEEMKEEMRKHFDQIDMYWDTTIVILDTMDFKGMWEDGIGQLKLILPDEEDWSSMQELFEKHMKRIDEMDWKFMEDFFAPFEELGNDRKKEDENSIEENSKKKKRKTYSL